MSLKVKSTVVIPNYKGINYIEQCLDSIYNGTDKADVIVVDNASDDGSLELVQSRFPQVRVIKNSENKGFSAAVNQGIAASRTPYVILLNNDTKVERNFVHELERVLDNDKEKKIFSASAKLISLYDRDRTDDAGDYYCALGWAFARGKGKNPERYANDCEIFAACAGGAIYRREFFSPEMVGAFDEEHFAYLEDIDICWRALIKGYRNCFAADAIVYHAGSAASGGRYNSFKTRLAASNSVYIIYKNMPLLQIIVNLPFLCAGFLVKWLFFVKKGMGKEYVAGLKDGIRRSRSGEGRTHRVRFKVDRLFNYVKIQIALWVNIVRLFIG